MLIHRDIPPPYVCNPYTRKFLQLPGMLGATWIQLRCIAKDNNGACKVVLIGGNDGGEREMEILQTVYHNDYDQDPYAKEFGLKISDRLASVEARILPAPWLKYHDTRKEKVCLPQVGQWNMMNKKMVNGGTTNHWACINFSRGVQESVALGFCHELAKCAKSLAW